MTGNPGWLLLIHSLPPKPPYLRAKVMRRLTQIGALPLKRSAYLLPMNEAALEDFQWLRQEIRAESGEAWIVEARFLGGLRDDEIRERYIKLGVMTAEEIDGQKEQLRALPATELPAASGLHWVTARA